MRSMDLTGGLEFEPTDDGTRMRWHWDLRPNGVLRFMGPLVASMGRRQERRIWTGLKRLLESRTGPQLTSGEIEDPGSSARLLEAQ